MPYLREDATQPSVPRFKMYKPLHTYDVLKIAAAAAAGLLILALAFSALLPETFSRAQAASITTSYTAPDDQTYSAKKKRKKRSRKSRGFDDFPDGGGGGGSYHTNNRPASATP